MTFVWSYNRLIVYAVRVVFEEKAAILSGVAIEMGGAIDKKRLLWRTSPIWPYLNVF